MKKRPVDFVALRRFNVPIEEIERRQPVVGRYASRKSQRLSGFQRRYAAHFTCDGDPRV
jgi:hypothetical protein